MGSHATLRWVVVVEVEGRRWQRRVGARSREQCQALAPLHDAAAGTAHVDTNCRTGVLRGVDYVGGVD